MTPLCTLLFSMGVLLFVTAGVFVVLRIVRMANDRDHAVGRHDRATPPPREYRESWDGRVLDEHGRVVAELADELEDVPMPRERGRRL